MAYTSASDQARIRASIAEKEAQLTIANETYTKLLANEIEEYRFDSNEGSQRARRYKMTEVRNQISALEAEIERLYRRLKSGGVVSVVLRRQ